MKKLLLAGLFFYGISSHAGMYSGDNYINVQAGLQIANDLFKIENGRLVLSYGMPLESNMGNYMGFTEIGIKAPTALLSLKYGYECRRDQTFSFGLDATLLFGISSLSLLGNYAMTDLVLGGEPGIFVKMNLADNTSVFVRGGVLLEAPIKNLNDLFFAPVIDLGLQYKL